MFKERGGRQFPQESVTNRNIHEDRRLQLTFTLNISPVLISSASSDGVPDGSIESCK